MISGLYALIKGWNHRWFRVFVAEGPNIHVKLL